VESEADLADYKSAPRSKAVGGGFSGHDAGEGYGLTPRGREYIQAFSSDACWSQSRRGPVIVAAVAFTRQAFSEGEIMVKLVVNAEQAKVLADARESVEILDPAGKRLGFFARPFSDHEIELARGRAAAGQSGRSTADVLERLAALRDR
jgi:hypothetical protein